MTLSKLAATLRPSETLAIKAKALELQAQGRSVIDLCAGEPDIDTPLYIREAANKALAEGKTRYTAVNGIPQLREALAEKLSKENGLTYKPAQIVITNGGKQALFNLFQMILNPGDEVIIIAPYWVSYPAMVEIAGGKPVVVKTTASSGYKADPESIKKALTPRTRCVIINSPSNPTGAGYTEEEQKAIGAVIAKSGALVCSDEVYEKEVYGGFKFASFAKACPELFSRTVTVNAFSKSYAMTGWRVGYAAGPQEIISAMSNYQSQVTSNVNTPAQWAAVAALKGSQDFVEPMVKNFERRIRLACELMEGSGLSVPVKPVGAFYLFVRFDEVLEKLKSRGMKGSTDLCNYFMDKAGVAAVPGEAFGDDSGFRISVACSDENVKEGVGRIVKAVKEL